ncbi:MAG: T9SS type A sorting domain-containing protein [Ignavibacteria bacterium]|nr:T9SS type A sorting domain-containing protein [Ignavibacteria bacterium]
MKFVKFIVFLVVLQSFCFGQSWVPQVNPSPGVMFSVYAYSSDVAWASGEFGKVLYTSNGGATWFNRSNAIFGSNNVLSIHGIDANTAICVCNVNGGKVFKSTNQGLSWQTMYSRQSTVFNDIQFVNSTTGFVFGNPTPADVRYYIIKTTNAGATFDTTSVARPTAPNINAQIMSNSTYLLQPGVGGPVYIWFGTNNGTVYYSANSGSLWSNSLTQNNEAVLSLTFINSLTGYAGGQDPFGSNNGGLGWSFLGTLQNTGKYFAFDNVNGQYFYSSGPSIYRSTNGGATFQLQYTNPSNEDFRDLSFVYTASDNSMSVINGWGVTGDGIVVKYTNTIGIETISTNVPSGYSLEQNFPNPFNPATSISFDIPKKGFVNLAMYDALGNLVKTIHNGELSAGSYKGDFDGTGFSSGVYFYRLQAGEFVQTKKMILTK